MTERDAEPAVGRLAGLKLRLEPRLAELRSSDTAKAGGLAAAMIVTNVIALGSTIVFARLLSDYSSLAALVSYFLILGVAGQAMQVATAREGVLGHLGVGHDLIVTLKRWARTMLWVTLALTALSVVFRAPIASAVGVKHYPWAAALGVPAACVWLELSILRGALQGVGDYRSVGVSLIGEQTTRLVTGAALAAAGLSVTGAYLGTPLSLVAMCGFCVWMMYKLTLTDGPESAGGEPVNAAAPIDIDLWTHVKRAWAPIAGLIVIAVLQNIDIIAAKHRLAGIKHLADSYAATAVAGKVLIWVAIGAGFYLVPEVSRRRSAGEDTRPVLVRALGIILVCAIPVLLIFAFGARPLLSLAFRHDQLLATNSLLILGIAFTILACTYLAIQYMLAQHRIGFLIFVGPVAIAEPVLLLAAPRNPSGFAAVVLGIQTVAAVVAFALALWRDKPPPKPAAPDGPHSDQLETLPLPVEV
ncbi:MAG: hypothetical protein M3018_02270 [Actinomycetota bacterium]|nr:hypothetical protein [Actinomycetota bacterium]